MTTHVVQYSGGIGSWAAAQRVIERHGRGDVRLLFADTLKRIRRGVSRPLTLARLRREHQTAPRKETA